MEWQDVVTASMAAAMALHEANPARLAAVATEWQRLGALASRPAVMVERSNLESLGFDHDRRSSRGAAVGC